MAKFKPAKGGKKDKAPAPTRGVVPCLIVVIGAMVLVFLLFRAMVSSGA